MCMSMSTYMHMFKNTSNLIMKSKQMIEIFSCGDASFCCYSKKQTQQTNKQTNKQTKTFPIISRILPGQIGRVTVNKVFFVLIFLGHQQKVPLKILWRFDLIWLRYLGSKNVYLFVCLFVCLLTCFLF